MRQVEPEPPASSRFYTSSNMLSIARAVLSVPFAAVMLSDRPDARVWGLVLLGLAALTDKLDGMLARKRNEVTEWGKILDPLADKIGFGIGALVLVMRGDMPLWFLAVIVGRDLLILAGGIFLKRSRGVVLSSNLPGKWAVGAVTVVFVLAVAGLRSVVTDLVMYAVTALLAVSLAVYAKRFWLTYRQQSDYGIAGPARAREAEGEPHAHARDARGARDAVDYRQEQDR